MRRLTAVLVAVTSLAAASTPPTAPVPVVRALRVGPIAEIRMGMELIFSGPAAPCGERLKGSVSVGGSAGVPVNGLVSTHPEGGCSVRFEMPFSAFGPDVLAKAKAPAIGWSLEGELSGKGRPRTVRWAGSIPREAVKPADSMKATLQRFVSVNEVRMESFGFGTSTLNVEMELRNPLAFDLQFVEAAYELTLGGEPLARGRKERFLVHAGRPNQLVLPVELSNAGVLSGLLRAATGGGIEGVLIGIAKLHVPGGELDLPFEFPVTLSTR